MKTLSDQDLKQVESAIAEVERYTSAEIVPVVVASCGDYFWAPWVLMFFGWSLAGVVLWEVDLATGGAVTTTEWLGFSAAVAAAGFAFGGFGEWRYLLVPGRVREKWARSRAEIAFHREGLVSTRGRTGVLIFVALREHQVVVLSDQTIHQKLGDQAWTDVVSKTLAGIRSGGLAQGLSDGIRRAGQLLTEYFPASSDNPNELRNSLRLEEN